ncbi:MAG: hypothetical protein CL797_03015 [Chromatiales bacterium]|nr:hypothetical protein [Chromatiales bacterium]
MDVTVQSPATLLKASIISAVLAAAILITVILPAEYGIDPTGAGEAIGLMPLASSTNTDNASEPIETPRDSEWQEDSATIVVPAGKGLEYKFYLVKGEAMRYDWSSTDGELYFDFHGEPEGDTTGYFESYTVSTGDQVRGTFTASFDGTHGWYWKNLSQSPITVTLRTQGQYKVLGIK